MRGGRPIKPQGRGPLFVFCGFVWEKLYGAEGRFVDSSTVKVSQTSRGISFDAIVPSAGVPTPATTQIYAGRIDTSSQFVTGGQYLVVNLLNASTTAPSKPPRGSYRVPTNAANVISVNVALPSLFRTNPVPTQGAIIWPPYTQGDEILFSSPDGYQQAADAGSPILTANDGTPIYWVEVGPAQRTWKIKTDFCSNGAFTKRYVASSGDGA